MINVVVTVWRDDRHVAVLSVTDERFLEDLKEWVTETSEYRLELVKHGPKHQ